LKKISIECISDYKKWLSHQHFFSYPAAMPILLEDLNLRKAERTLCEQALRKGGSIVEAAQLLGITRHALKRRMVKYRIEWSGAVELRDMRAPAADVPMALASDGV
jgi:DNA-binding NtrC family response regulator